MESYSQKIKSLLSNSRWEIIALTTVTVLALFLRLYKIREFAIFLGDEGRDALAVKRMIVDHRFTLLGPTASVGGFYLGPVYYYFMIPFLWLFNLDPVGPAVMVALVGTLTVLLLYAVVRDWVSPFAAALAALIYATAPEIVAASRSSWNPNIMPFFSLLSFYALARGLTSQKNWWLVVAGASYGITIQLHYLGLIIGPLLVVTTIFKKPLNAWLSSLLWETFGFLAGASLFLAFELRHNFPNTIHVFEFIARGGETTGPRSFNLVWLVLEMLRRTYEAVLPFTDNLIRILIVVSLTGLLATLITLKKRKKRISAGLITLIVWLLGGTVGIGMYKGHLHPHYFGFLFPLPFILLGLSGQLFARYTNKLFVCALFTPLILVNLTNLNIWGKGSNLIEQTKNVAREVTAISGGEPFNFALITNGNSDHAYRYFLEVLGAKPLPLEDKITEQLIVVCENPSIPCSPLGHPVWEVAGFGRAEIVEERTAPPDIKIIRLVHHEDSTSLIGKPAPKGQ